MTLEAEPVSPGEALSGKLSGKFLIISNLPTTKMSCMLKHFRSRVSAQVEILCLLAKLWSRRWSRRVSVTYVA